MEKHAHLKKNHVEKAKFLNGTSTKKSIMADAVNRSLKKNLKCSHGIALVDLG